MAGGTDASNIAPYAQMPSLGNPWVKTEPHVLIVGAEPTFNDVHPKDPVPDATVLS